MLPWIRIEEVLCSVAVMNVPVNYQYPVNKSKSVTGNDMISFFNPNKLPINYYPV